MKIINIRRRSKGVEDFLIFQWRFNLKSPIKESRKLFQVIKRFSSISIWKCSINLWRFPKKLEKTSVSGRWFWTAVDYKTARVLQEESKELQNLIGKKDI